MKVKTILENNVTNLEEAINDFLSTENVVKVEDIKYNCTESFVTAMIIYR